MTDPAVLKNIRVTLDALAAGASTLEDLERILEGALESGAITPADAKGALNSAGSNGIVPAEMLRRLGLASAGETRAAQETRLRMPEGNAEKASAASAQTRFRSADAPAAPASQPAPDRSHAPQNAGTAAIKGAAETRLRSSSTSPPPPVVPQSHAEQRVTASNWIDPDRDPNDVPQESEVTTGSLLSGRYLLERRLGEGGMGVVYLASDQEVKGETFAVKVLKPEIRERPESLALLREEVRRTRSLPHPNIVGVYSLNSDKSNVYMLMEFLEGKSLDALIDEDFGRGVPYERAWPLIQDIGSGLAFAHDHSVIHSDLKPSNVFITTGGRVKLVDFGIARAARGRTRGVDPASLGALTPGYASCEMLEGLEPDVRDDIYALACVIYEMLSGKHPFGGLTAVEAREGKKQPAALAALSRSQNAALAGGLAFEREGRTGSVEALVAGLSPAARSNSRRAPLIVAGLIVFAALGAVGWWVWSNSRHESSSPATSPPVTAAAGNVSLARARDLADQARRLDVDPADPSLVEGRQRLRAAEQQLAGGHNSEGSQALSQAEAALLAAISGGGRVAHIGSEADEVQLAVSLCSRAGARCSAADFADEAPRTVVLRPFALDTTGITNAQFADFVKATGIVTSAERGQGLFSVAGTKLVPHPGESWKTLRDQGGAGTDPAGFPVRGIDYESAKAYCAWAGKRLPTEEEWEFVARPDHRIFPWGNDPLSAEATAVQRLLPVAEQNATGRFGARGLGGTLWEWVEGGTGSDRVFRGASWLDTDIVHRRLAMRGLETPTRAHVDTGFRCAGSADRWPGEPPAADAR
jgi:formylglycine-generating enzyme required for sulfatase activity